MKARLLALTSSTAARSRRWPNRKTKPSAISARRLRTDGGSATGSVGSAARSDGSVAGSDGGLWTTEPPAPADGLAFPTGGPGAGGSG